MASVFLSYDREDAARARSIAQALDKAGHNVWWDRHIKGGAQYSKAIEAALKAADAVVVLWSQRSVESAWVRDEAAAGRDSGRLVPVSLDGTDPPMGFRQYQTIDLPGGRLGKGQREALLAAIDALSGSGVAEARPPARRFRAVPQAAWLVAGLGLLVALAAGLLLSKPWTKSGEVILSVGPGSGDSASQALAHDLAIKLGVLQSTSAGPIKLVEATESKQADLAFEITNTGPATAALVLKSPKDGSLLWSMDFEHPSGKRADLVQQVTYTAARIVGCAVEGMGGPVKLKPTPLKAYLNACAQLSDMASFDLRPPLPLLLQVLKVSPRFEPAWRALLLSEADLASPERMDAEPDARLLADLRRHIAEARTINPTMPAVDIAEAMLLPPRDFIGRMKQIEQAAAGAPADPIILDRLAGALTEVGRLRKAVELAAETVKLDPLSPVLHSKYTAGIAYAGNFDAAKRELAKAERLWPGTASLEDAQYRFHLRYGDPRIARALFDKYTDTGGRGPLMLLEARQNPGPATIEPLIAYVRERMRNMENPSVGLGFATVALAQFDRKEDLFALLLSWPEPGDIAIMSEVFFRPEFKEERRDPRFLRITHRAGLLDYWRQSGKWPDFCSEPGLPYNCKTEAAKLS